MTVRGLVALTAVMLVSACGGSLGSRADIAARAGEYELDVERLAELMAGSKRVPVQREAAEALAYLWLDYALFAERLLGGDSFTQYVDAAMWPDIQQELADRHHAQLIAEQVALDSAALDSVYAAGDLRLVKQLLFRVQPSATAAVKATRRRALEAVAAQLAAGRLTWSAAVPRSDDAPSRARDGSVGVLARGEMVVPFETAAYALAPGQRTEVVESSFGFHILWRPELRDVRDEFKTGVEARLEQAFDTKYLAELPERWDIRVREDASATVRTFGDDLMRAKTSRKLLGTYRGGRFDMSAFSRWLQATPADIRRRLKDASDAQLTDLVTMFMRNQVLVEEARQAGVTLAPEVRTELTDRLRQDVADLAALLRVSADSLPDLEGQSDAERREVVTTRVLEYLAAVAGNRKPMQAVPPFLADTLRREVRWGILASGVERSVERARELRGPGPEPTAAPVAPKRSTR